MRSEFLPFAKPVISEEAILEVTDCLRSGWITTGPRVQQFEKLLQAYLMAPCAYTVTSATAGLHLALAGLGLTTGDEVITTPLTFVATLNTIVHVGAKPVLVDIAPNSYNIDVTKIEKVITPKTRAIMPVHFAGIAVDLEPIYELAHKHNLYVIEDAAHAIGAKYKGKIIGSFGDTQVFSFHPNKNITTGEGGAITTSNAELARKIKILRFHGIDREAWNRFGKTGSQNYEVVAPGFKYNMMDIQAALGLHQLPQLDNFIAKRTILAERYLKLFKGWPQLTLPSSPSYDHTNAWHLFAPLINIEAHMTRDEFIKGMKERNIGTGLHYQPVHLYPYYRQNFGFKEGDFPNAEYVGKHIVSLPLFPTMTREDQDDVVAAMAELFAS